MARSNPSRISEKQKDGYKNNKDGDMMADAAVK